MCTPSFLSSKVRADGPHALGVGAVHLARVRRDPSQALLSQRRAEALEDDSREGHVPIDSGRLVQVLGAFREPRERLLERLAGGPADGNERVAPGFAAETRDGGFFVVAPNVGVRVPLLHFPRNAEHHGVADGVQRARRLDDVGALGDVGVEREREGLVVPDELRGASTHVPCVQRVNRDAHATTFPLSALRC